MLGIVVHTFNPSIKKAEAGVDLYEFTANLHYIAPHSWP